MENKFNHTRQAIAEYDRTAQERQQVWDSIQTSEDVDIAERIDEAALRAVQDAFYEDTKDINTLSHCRRVDIGFMRRLAESTSGNE